ncbi:TIR domain-containing protein [Hyphomicrobium facile]|uniref:MTH538 TIR-like domain n=1 Tax=Hyphomicrobium facile TaxID=51670 RepID=A0A1I7N2I0_9HYPH|nr:TIR domain-containing protein [Hyphomicrobium facile]SFV28870.1 MTH538 TIR-like domain [Hyphomicrobium facile]
MANVAYIVFDGDNDKWAYAYIKGWKENKNIDFDYNDAHDLDSMSGRAQYEQYVKSKLRERMEESDAVVVLIGEKTKNLYKYIRWELDLALDLGLPIIAANLNKTNGQDADLCPAIIRDKACVVHIPYTLKALKHAMTNFPGFFRRLSAAEKKAKTTYSYKQFDT